MSRGKALWSWSVRHARWLRPPTVVLLIVAAAGAPVAIALAATDDRATRESVFVVGGLLVQLAGFVTVWFQIRSALTEHGRPGLWSRVVTWARSRKTRIVMAAGGGVLGLGGVNASGRVRTPVTGSVDERIAALVRNFEHLENEVSAQHQETRTKLQSLGSRIDHEVAERKAITDDVLNRIRQSAIGSADLQLIGLLWFVVGSVWSTLAGPIANLLD